VPDQEAIEDQKQLLAAYRRTLAQYLKQQAMIGLVHIQPGVAQGIREARSNIRRIKAILRGWETEVEDYPDDEEPLDDIAPQPTISHVRGAPTRPGRQSIATIVGILGLIAVIVFLFLRSVTSDWINSRPQATTITASTASTSAPTPIVASDTSQNKATPTVQLTQPPNPIALPSPQPTIALVIQVVIPTLPPTDTPVPTFTSAPTIPSTDTSVPVDTSIPELPTFLPQPNTPPDQMIRDYWALVVARNYEAAWQYLSENYQQGIHDGQRSNYETGWENINPCRIEVEITNVNQGVATTQVLAHWTLYSGNACTKEEDDHEYFLIISKNGLYWLIDDVQSRQ
jgi:hypothetical protein